MSELNEMDGCLARIPPCECTYAWRKNARLVRINSTETSAISMMRSLPPDQRQWALDYFKTKKKYISEDVIRELETYVYQGN
jgi:hypothetical protein